MSRKSVWAAILAAMFLVGAALAPVAAADPGATNGRIAFGTRANGFFNIETVMPDGSGSKLVTSGDSFHLCPEYSPDGRKIFFCANTSGAWEIWTMKQNGAKPTQLTHFGAFVVFPDVSPDGSKIAFTGFIDEPANDQIFVVDAATGEDLVQLTTCPAAYPNCFSSYPVWSPDGSKIAFSHADGFDANDFPLNEQIYVMNADGTNPHPITTGPAPKDQVPDWSPDGSKISFTVGYPGDGGIWTINADGSGAVQLTGCTAGDPSPCPTGDDWGTAWSPDGRKIVFLRDLTNLGISDRQVTIINTDGSGAHSISTPGLHAVPTWQARGVSQGG
jgi:TolB protein